MTNVAGRIFTIPPGMAFVDALAAHLLAEADGDPLRLAEMEVLLPNRRACRSGREAFLRLSGGKPLLLPRLRPMDGGDGDEAELFADGPLDIPPAISPIERHLLLTRLVLAMGSGRGGLPPTPDQAARLAAELAALLDAVQIERIDFSRLETLVPEDYAEHWQVTLKFLTIVTELWPALLGDRLDPQERINRILDAQAARWRSDPPDTPVIAAGSTGSRPASAELIAVIAGLPRGKVVLPGLDLAMDEAAWAALDESHPQFGMKKLLAHLGVERRAVRPLGREPDPRGARAALLAEALRPAATCEAWRDMGEFPAATLDGVSRLDAPTPREEAGAIALILRETLEKDGRTAALVTPDRTLARRVAAELERWGLVIDDSAGQPLDTSEPGCFLRLLAEMVADDFAPHATLSCLKHPLAAAGDDTAAFRALVRRLETAALRGPRPAPGIAGLKAAAKDGKIRDGLDRVAAALEPFVRVMAQETAPLADLVRTHMEAAEALAATPLLPGPARLWKGEAGEALAGWAGDLTTAAQAVGATFPAIPPRFYPALFEQLLSGQVVRQAWGSHPRLFLWGPMEARLQKADVMVLGGLNEGTWPGEAQADPWMSRPMRAAFGLPAPERKIGLAAHDFAMAFAAPRVVLSRSARVDGTPTVPARWLLRLKAVMDAAGLDFGEDATPFLDWHTRLDRPEAFERVAPPAPRPPVTARPRKLSVTEIETWMRDPYGIYAKHILGLRALDPIDADPGAAEYGSLVHAAIETFLNEISGPLPADAETRLLTIGREVFADVLDRPGVWAFWWPRFVSVARWLVAHESARRADIARTHCEIKGALEIDAPAGPFLLHARADRVDVLRDGTLALVDYKTGQPPSPREVAAGYAPQLPLEAAIARFGGFEGVAPAEVARMLYWRLKGGADGGEEKSAGDNPRQLTDQAIEGLKALVATFDDERTPYGARPHPDRAPKYSDYQHLARIREWSTAAEDAEE
ncbi:double-strand break repair protein AddB [Magnetospirillum aberrantis]|uniref:Double-strand break repair protein AddB n=1 Tax=Magnetospirillum aberrantis SpK TaxID=908842 RepID=A0A7C9QR86_9PROT|nr:double-strand break repair protein AddB [Magnetospirillum aberrantis]NFV78640.1 double-strand break repair protein AddB [Magnetospirillum aberrantis SpK]